MNNSEVARRFVGGADTGTGSNMQIEAVGSGVVGIYSWSCRCHFPMAYMLPDGTMLRNGDKYSNSTSRHQGHLLRACMGTRFEETPTVSFHALRSAGITPERFDYRILDSTPDVWITGIVRLPDGGWQRHIRDGGGQHVETVDFTPPKLGMYLEGSRAWHVLGAILIRDLTMGRRKGSRLLCGLDEGVYFCARLPTWANTVEQGFADLKPGAVRAAEAAGADVQRQGEWFAIPTGWGDRELAGNMGLTIKALRELATQTHLPRPDKHSSRHVVLHVEHGGLIYGRGRMVHWSWWQDQASGQHRSLKFGDRWFELHRDTQIESVTVDGDVD